MPSDKHVKLAIKILSLLLIAAVSFFFAAKWFSDTYFVKESLERVEESSQTVTIFSTATLSISLAISAMPDDFASPLANTFADMNIYFVVILVVLFLEKIIILYGIKLSFAILLPSACVLGAFSAAFRNNALKTLAIRLCALALTVVFVVPCSTFVTNYVAADLTAYVEETISETTAGADKLNGAMEGGSEDRNIFEKLSDLFRTAIKDISDLMLHFRNNIRRCMHSIAILILTNCIMPLLTFFLLKWILKETFNIVIPTPHFKRRNRSDSDTEPDTDPVAPGE